MYRKHFNLNKILKESAVMILKLIVLRKRLQAKYKTYPHVNILKINLKIRNTILGAVYMGGGTGRLPGRDVFHPGFT